MQDTIDRILAADRFAVAGASKNPEKYGHMVVLSLVEAGKHVDPVNPTADEIAGLPCFPSLTDVPTVPEVVVFVTQPEVTRAGLKECARLGVKLVWVQEGAEFEGIEEALAESGIDAVYGGPCIMVALRTAKYRIHH